MAPSLAVLAVTQPESRSSLERMRLDSVWPLAKNAIRFWPPEGRFHDNFEEFRSPAGGDRFRPSKDYLTSRAVRAPASRDSFQGMREQGWIPRIISELLQPDATQLFVELGIGWGARTRGCEWGPEDFMFRLVGCEPEKLAQAD